MAQTNEIEAGAARPGILARVVRRARILAGTALVGALAFGAVSFGTDVIAANTVRVAVEAASAPVSVSVIRVAKTDGYEVTQEFIGTLEPRQDTGLGFEAGGTLAQILVDEGDPVVQGQLLAQLDIRSLEAQQARQRAGLSAMQAQVDLAELTYERQQALAERSFASQQRADETRLGLVELRARLAEAEAALVEIEIALDKSELRAPFDGVVAARFADAGARVGPTVTVVELQETAAPQVRIGVSPAVAAELGDGTIASIRLQGRDYEAQFANRGTALNPVTRTVDVLFDLETGTEVPPYGAVATLSVRRAIGETGAWVPLSALSEGPRGLWTLLTVENDQVTREAVEVIHAEETRAFVRGALPDKTLVITSGTHRVAPGQAVFAAEG